MKKGNWMPISKAAVKHLPKDRPYTELEALFSVQYDYDCKRPVTVSGYSALWSWSRTKVAKFLDLIGAEVFHESNTEKLRNQKGHIKKHIKDIKETNKEHIRLCENSVLQEEKDIKKTYKEHKKNISKSTTKEPTTILEPKPKEKGVIYSGDFLSFWGAYPNKKSKKTAWDTWEKIRKKGDLPNVDQLRTAIEYEKKDKAFSQETRGFSPDWKHPSTWLNAYSWQDTFVVSDE